jgi:pimeloyl-ACP methyl ester carboxylesterase
MQLAHERVSSGSGAGRPIVLVHGITERGEGWRPLVAPLAEDHVVLVVDLRGHGASAKGDRYDPLTLATDVHDTVIAADLGSEAPLMIGHSLGGVVVSAYAAMFPARGVINVDQPLRLAGFKDALAQLEPMLRGSRESFEEAIGMVFDSMMGPLDAEQAARIVALRRADQDVVLGIWGTVFDSTPDELDAQVGALAGGITVPYLSLHGIDPGDEYTAWLTSVVPSATVEVWADHGHYPHLIDEPRFLDRVRAFDATL